MNIPGYRIERLIGRGGMAAVYLAVQESVDRHVALKVLDQTFADDPAFSERFVNEGRIIGRLNHGNTITIYDVGIVEGLHYISMEYVEGGDLKARIKGGMEPMAALDLLETMGGCLDFAHRAGVVHRDVKPANILFRKDGTPLLTDFGIAKRLQAHGDLTLTGSVLGSPGYLAPEQAEGREVDGRADIYSLGIMFYEMLAGKKPYQGDSDLSTIFKHLSEPIPELPSDLARCQPLLNRMIAKKPEDRFEDAAVMLAFVKSIRASGPLTSRPIIQAPDQRKAAKRKRGRGRAGKWIGIGLGIPVAMAVAAVGTNSMLPEPIPEIEKVRQLIAQLWPYKHPPTAPPERVASVEPARPARPEKAAPEPEAEPPVPTTPPEPTQTVPATPSPRQNGTVVAPAYGIVASKPEPVDIVVPKPEPVDKEPERDPIWYEIDKFLTLADKAYLGYRLTQPPQDNALHYYRKVLDLDRRNKRAKLGLWKIAVRYASLAEDQIRASDYHRAKQYVSLGLRAHGRNQRLLTLQRDVETRIKIGGLLARADAALAKQRLRTPPNDNAFFYYQKVLELDPGNELAKNGFAKIARRYAWLAEAHIAKYEYTEARRYITLGLEVQPTDPKLLALKEEAHFKNAPKHLMDNVKGLFKGF